MLEEYLNQDVFNPKYLFHGSPYEMKKIEPRQSSDSENKNNEDDAIFLTSWFINATAYAFSRKLKELNANFTFSMNNSKELPAMSFEVDVLPNDLYGYVYVFDIKDDMIKDNREYTTQYRCYHELEPIDIIKVYYKDFEEYFNRENISKLK